MQRCDWPGLDALYIDYHDTDWGVPEYDSRALWEKLVLDGFQAGLSWITILKKREAFREAFEGFNPEKVAAFTEQDVERLMKNEGIVRHRGKIEAAIKGARQFIRIEEEQGFANFVWAYVDGKPIINNFNTHAEVPAKTELSAQLSKDLKKEGFTFCGPTIVYAWMQACGLVNDHMIGCFRHAEVNALAR